MLAKTPVIRTIWTAPLFTLHILWPDCHLFLWGITRMLEMGWQAYRILMHPAIWKATAPHHLIRDIPSEARSQGSFADASTSNWYESHQNSLVRAPQSTLGPRFQSTLRLPNPRTRLERAGLPSLWFSSSHSLQGYIGFSFIFAWRLPFPQLLLSSFSVSISTLLWNVRFQSRSCACFSRHQSAPASPCSPPSIPFSLFLCVSLETGLVAWLPSAALLFFFLWGWDQMASNRSSWSPWLPGWQSTWERHILQPGAVRPFMILNEQLGLLLRPGRMRAALAIVLGMPRSSVSSGRSGVT